MAVSRAKQLHKELLEIGSSYEPKMRTAFNAAMDELISTPGVVSAVRSLSSGAMTTFEFNRQFDVALSVFRPKQLVDVMLKIQSAGFNAFGSKIGLDPIKNAANWAEGHASQRVAGITSTSAKAVREAVARGIENGVPIKKVADSIRANLKLTPQLAQAADNMRAALTANGTKPAAVERQVDAYKSRSIKYRAQTVAQTETMEALNMGARQSLIYSYSQGLLTANDKMIWITAKDERTCPTCGSLSGMTVSIGGNFTLSEGTIDAPPAHARCRCTIGLA